MGNYTSYSSSSPCRYPYRDPNNSLGYYTHERSPYPAPSAMLDRYYTADYTKDWSGAYAKYPPEQYLPSYEPQHASISTAYPPPPGHLGWERNQEVYPDPYQEDSSSRSGQGAVTRDIPYSYYHRAVPYRAQAGYPEEAYLHPRAHYPSFGPVTVADRYAKQRLAPVSDGDPGRSVRQQDGGRHELVQHRLYRPWVVAGGVMQGQQAVVVEGHVAALGPQLNPASQQLHPLGEGMGCGREGAGRVESARGVTRGVNQLPAQHAQP